VLDDILHGVPEDERLAMTVTNAAQLYKTSAASPATDRAGG
jgi:hypothetical protein